MSQPELVAENLGFTEGPVHREDGTVLLVSMSRGEILHADLKSGDVRKYAETGGGPNGLASSADGTLYVAQNGARVLGRTRSFAVPPAVQAVDPTSRKVTQLAADGRFNAPNDCALAPDGSLWFTDPFRHDQEGDGSGGQLWHLEVGGGRTTVVRDQLSHPNGLAFSPDGAALYVGDTVEEVLVEYEWSDGTASPTGRRIDIPVGRPDGFCVDRDGHAFVATTVGACVLVVSLASGEVVERFDLVVESFPTNVCFVGSDHSQLVVTDAKKGRLWFIDAGCRGREPNDFVDR